MAHSPNTHNPAPHTWVQTGLGWLSRLGHPIFLSTVVTSTLVLTARALGGLQGLELGMYDQSIRLRPALPSDERILVVGIDDIDVQTRQEWPIEDSTLATLLTALLAEEPRAIGLDLFRDVRIGEGQEDLLNQIQSNDQIVPVCRISSPETPGVPPPTGTPEEQVGFADLVVDPGGILRRTLLVTIPPAESNVAAAHLCSDPNAQLLSFSFQLALRYLAQEDINLEPTQAGELAFQDVILERLEADIGGYQDVDAAGYQMMLNFRASEDAVPQVSLREVLSGQVAPELIRDRVVLIGVTTPEAKDDFYTPYSGGQRDSQKMPGVVVHAQAVSQLLSAVLEGRPLLWSWSDAGERIWIIAWSLGGALFAWYIRRPAPFTLGIIALLGGLYGACYTLLLTAGGWIPVVPPALALSLASGGVIVLDRFSKSDYGQAVYRQVKNLLRLEIEIDRDVVSQQVTEITETEYFSQLQQQARQLRQPDTAKSTGASIEPPKGKADDSAHQATISGDGNHDEPQDESTPPADDSANMNSYLDNLKREARKIKRSQPDSEDKS